MSGSGVNVLAFYQQRLNEIQNGIRELQDKQHLLVIAFVFFAAVLAVMVLGTWRGKPVALASASVATIAGFVAGRKYFEFGRQSHELALRGCVYERGVERSTGTWIGKGNGGLAYARKSHLYQDDLSILGEGSLFEFLCTTRSEAGAERLASYLLDSSDPEEIEARQEAVRELRNAIELREAIALLGKFHFQECDPTVFERWLSNPVLKVHGSLQILLLLSSLPCLALGIGILAGLLNLSSVWPLFLVLFALQVGIGAIFYRRVHPLIQNLKTMAGDFAVLWQGLRLLQNQQFRSAKLRGLVQAVSGNDAWKKTRRIEQLVWAIEQRYKDILYFPSLLLAVGTQLVFAIERWREKHQESLKAWLDTWAEFEALNALACYAYEHPEAVFPRLAAGNTVFEANGLGHPLIPKTSCVRNDVVFNDSTRFYILSGSNMSGKSTFLRTIGLNAVLAYAGAPVLANEARISPFFICASIAIKDSLVEGKSKYLAEVERLRNGLLDVDQDKPVLFLIDEILSGTNSRDRKTVAEAVIKAYVAGGAVGVVSTHDLALTEIEDMPKLRGKNVHMESENPENALDFDYRVKPGRLNRSNAIAIAKMIGVAV